jgi:hypothetical protein
MANSLTTLNPITGAESIPTFAGGRATPLYVTITALMAYFRATFTSPAFVPTITTPGDGFTLNLPLNSNNQWVLLRPTGALATGAIVLPSSTYLIDGQEILVTTTLQITSFTVNGNGATAVYGAPSVLAAEDKFTLRYNALTTSWYCVA